ncbi:DUF2142 domain-containing protein [Actinotalea sp. K2]|uniref:DUF2142 domain-containing protein n=1 Tax=Actinotalea sp. K2 TaxID=2939438 RepID=UPI002017E34D|nr:DUF2142 domain-containing protein [Actinotalea sp. K2]MCL3862706.1 DUF2142 domain-containing protein [Actinotalea sp. K2]
MQSAASPTRATSSAIDARRERRPLRAWLAGGILLFLMTAAWSAAIPLMGSPDEPSHVVKAAAVARGQWSGELGPPPTDTSRPGAGTIVQLPDDFAAALALPNCFAFQPAVPASCQQDLAPAGPGTVAVETFAGQYPPLYYAAVGWPSLVLGAEASVYAMRLLSALLTAGLVTWGAYRLSTVPGNGLALWGAAAAMTPMTLFLGGTVNPQGLEIALAFSFWAACLSLVARRGVVTTSGIVHAAISGALLVNVRTSSPFWALVIVVVALVVAPSGRWRELVAHRAARWAGVAAALASVTAVAWVAVHRGVVTGGDLYPHYADLRLTLLEITGDGYGYLANMIGNFGWLDAPAPPVTMLAWYIGAGAVILAATSLSAPIRQRAGLLLLVLAVAGSPFALQIPTATNAGLIWQGRYALPIAVGVPLLAALLLGGEHAATRAALRRMLRGALVVLLVGHVAAFYWASRRYSEGLEGDLFALTPDWSSPIGYLTGTAAFAAAATALTVMVWRAVPPVPDEVSSARDAAIRSPGTVPGEHTARTP